MHPKYKKLSQSRRNKISLTAANELNMTHTNYTLLKPYRIFALVIRVFSYLNAFPFASHATEILHKNNLIELANNLELFSLWSSISYFGR